MISIGIDQSISSTGIVIFENDVMINHVLVQSKPIKGLKEKVKRLKKMTEGVLEVVDKYESPKIFIEEIAYAGQGDAAKDLAGLFYMILSSFEDKGIDYEVVNIKSLKKLATGNGNAKKEEVFESLPEEVKDIFGKIPKTRGRYDLADAYHMAYTGKNLVR